MQWMRWFMSRCIRASLQDKKAKYRFLPPRGAGDCPCALSVSASIVRLSQDRRDCVRAMLRQDNRAEATCYMGRSRSVKPISRTIHNREHMTTSRACLAHARDADEWVMYISSVCPLRSGMGPPAPAPLLLRVALATAVT